MGLEGSAFRLLGEVRGWELGGLLRASKGFLWLRVQGLGFRVSSCMGLSIHAPMAPPHFWHLRVAVHPAPSDPSIVALKNPSLSSVVPTRSEKSQAATHIT